MSVRKGGKASLVVFYKKSSSNGKRPKRRAMTTAQAPRGWRAASPQLKNAEVAAPSDGFVSC